MLDDLIALTAGPHIEMILAVVTGLLLAALIAVLGEWRNMDKKEKAAQAGATAEKRGQVKNLSKVYQRPAGRARG